MTDTAPAPMEGRRATELSRVMSAAYSVALPTTPVQALAYSISDTSKALGCGRDKTYDLIREGKLRVVKLGSRSVVPVRDIERLLGLDSSASA